MDSIFLDATAPTDDYTLSLHDALPIWTAPRGSRRRAGPRSRSNRWSPRRGTAPGERGRSLQDSERVSEAADGQCGTRRSEEHTSELQSPCNLVCRLLLEKKKHIRKH